MRKLYYFIATLLVLIGLSQCRKPVFPDYGGGGKQTISFTTSDDGSKGYFFQEGSLGDDAYKVLKYRWTSTDKVYVYASVSGTFGENQSQYCGVLEIDNANMDWDNHPTIGMFKGDVIMPSGMAEGTSKVRFYHFGSDVNYDNDTHTANVSYAQQNGELINNNSVSSKVVVMVEKGYVSDGKYSNCVLKTQFAIAKVNLESFAEAVIITKGISGTNIINTGITVNEFGVLGYTSGTQMNLAYKTGDYYIVFVPDSESKGSEKDDPQPQTYTLVSTQKSTTVSLVVKPNAFCTPGGDGGAAVLKPLYKNWLPGKFSISSTRQVQFSRGNLQYLGTGKSGTLTPSWRFAEHQYDYFGDGGTNSGNATVNEYSAYNFVEGENAARDLFGWGCTGYYDNRKTNGGYQKDYQPYSTQYTASTKPKINYWRYGPDYTNESTGGLDLSVEHRSDWGYIENLPGNTSTDKIWFTMTYNDWDYLLNQRENKRYVKANIEYETGKTVNGLVILPDDWEDEYSILNSYNTVDAGYTTNSLTLNEWENLESSGAVFLPASGSRKSVGGGSFTGPDNVGTVGNYHTSSFSTKVSNESQSVYSYVMNFSGSGLSTNAERGRVLGNAVRLVTDVKSNGNGTAEGFGGGNW